MEKKKNTKVIIIIAVIALLLLCCCGGLFASQSGSSSSSSSKETKSSKTEEAKSEDISGEVEEAKEEVTEEVAEEPKEEPEEEVKDVEYEAHTVAEMMDDLDSNALKASDKYKGKYIEITGKLDNIDASGDYISLVSDKDEFAMTGVLCYIKNSTQTEQVSNMNIGDKVKLRGKCTDVGEVLGYYLDIDQIAGFKDSAKKEDSKDSYEVTAKEIEDELQSNALNAKNKYEGKTVTITGYLDNIDASGKYINIDAGEDDYTFVNIQCNITNDEQKNRIYDLSKGDKVTVKGKCVSVGEFLGYTIDMDSIK